MPFLCLLTALISVSWGIFAKSVLQYAVKVAVRDGITVDAVAAGSSNLTTIVKNLVQQNSFGFLKNTSLVHVHYYQPPSPGSTGPVTDVSTVTTGSRPGNYPGNIMVVSVDGFSLPPLMVRIFTWSQQDKSSTSITVSSADLIEPIDPNDLAPLGTAP
jgi:Flp pilus assembly protein TadG